MAFEQYKGNGIRAAQGLPMMTINKDRGLFNFNVTCTERFLRKISSVDAFMDRPKSILAFKQGTTFRLHELPGGSARRFASQDLIKHYKLESFTGRAHSCRWNEEEKMLEVLLK